MTPYLRLQLVYLVVAGVATAAAWWLSGRPRALAQRPWTRLIATGVGFGLPLLAGALIVRAVDDPHSTYQFAFVALAFYAGVLWGPLCLLIEVVGRARRGLEPQRLLVLAALVAMGVGGFALLVEPNRLVSTEHHLRLPGWSADVEPLRVVHVSDLQSVGACERERRAAELVNALQPDLVVVTGDYAAGPFDDTRPSVAAARAFLGALRARHGVVCLAGHAESESLRREIFAGLDVLYLRNDELELDLSEGGPRRRLRLIAVTANDADFSHAQPRVEPGLVTLALSHEPDASWEFEGRGVDLHLAGHTHGGQIALPFLGPPLTLSQLPRRYARGLRRFGDHWLHVSAGIGMEGNHAPRIRLLCPPSVDLLVLAGGGEPLRPEAPPPRP